MTSQKTEVGKTRGMEEETRGREEEKCCKAAQDVLSDITAAGHLITSDI